MDAATKPPQGHTARIKIAGTECTFETGRIAKLASAAIVGRCGDDVVLATVVRTWGSAPRQAGSQMCIDEHGHFVGSVSGGCVEGAVIQEAQELMVQGGTKILKFGVTDEQAWEVGLTCGGEVEIYVERVE